MDPTLADRLERMVSPSRLYRYRSASVDDTEAVVLYCRNILIGESLLPSLSMLEVVLRNAAHRVLSTRTGTEWWFKPVLHQQSYDNILKLMTDLTRRLGHPPAVGKVISEITFGFWPKLFAHRYQALWWDELPRLLPLVLPNHPNMARDTRGKFEQRLEYAVALRNRVVHQETIFQGVAALNRPVLPIDVIHDQIIETIGWIDLDAAALVSCFDRFRDTFSPAGQAVLESAIRQRFPRQ